MARIKSNGSIAAFNIILRFKWVGPGMISIESVNLVEPQLVIDGTVAVDDGVAVLCCPRLHDGGHIHPVTDDTFLAGFLVQHGPQLRTVGVQVFANEGETKQQQLTCTESAEPAVIDWYFK